MIVHSNEEINDSIKFIYILCIRYILYSDVVNMSTKYFIFTTLPKLYALMFYRHLHYYLIYIIDGNILLNFHIDYFLFCPRYKIERLMILDN